MPAAAPQKPAGPVADPVVLQRALVYAVIGFVAFTGLVLTMAFKDPCAGAPTGFGVAKCHATLQQRLPGPEPITAMVLVFLSTMALYELRWYVRSWLVGAIGLGEIVVAVLVLSSGMSKVLGICNGLVGISLVAAAWGIQRDQRGAWAYAVSACATLTGVYFFGSAKVHSATGAHLAWAVLPALAVYLPATVMLLTSAPGAPRYRPFAKVPIAPTARR